MKRDLPFACIVCLLSGCAAAQPRTPSAPVTVTLDPACVRNIGGVTRFRREQFITIHASPIDKNMSDRDWDFLLNDLQVSFGREGGSRTWWRSQTPADPERPDFPDVAAIQRLGRKAREDRIAHGRNNPAHWREMILCTHPESYYARPDNNAAPWGPRTIEGAAEFTANYLKCFWTDDERPRYLEVFNEPLIKLREIGGNVDDACRQHVAVARRVRDLCPNVLVGGYTAAYPEFELRNFQHWNGWMKRFMDLAGKEMDFFSTHIYDGVNKDGSRRRRTGSNAEAIIDTIDAYSFILFGKAKPQIISEFGFIPTPPKAPVGLPYSPKVAGQMVHTIIAQVMQFMNHADRLIKVVPFILTKADWTYDLPGCSEETPYPFLLWRKKGKEYVLTDLTLYYRFWKDVRGEWRWSTSDDPDVLCHFLADGRRLFVVLCNIEDRPNTVELSGLSGLAPKRIALRRLTTHGESPRLTETVLTALPNTVRLETGESDLLVIDLPTPVAAVRRVRQYRCYASTYMQDIEADKPIVFRFHDVPSGKGAATLRLSIGRPHGKSLSPVVTLNGEKFPAGPDWAGGDQSSRKNFFGVIEVPVPAKLLSANPSFEVTFPDSGGKVAAAVLQVNRESAL